MRYLESYNETEATFLIDNGIGEVRNEWGEDVGIRAHAFSQYLKEYGTGKNITVKINSFGGSLAEALQIYDSIKTTPNCNTLVVGVAASAGSIVLLAGKKVQMAEGALIMIHKARMKMDDFMTADMMRKEADTVDKWNDAMSKIYEGKTGKPAAEWLKMMDSDYWIDSSEALELKLVDEVITFDGKKKKVSKSEASSLGADKIYNSFQSQLNTLNTIPMKEKILAALALAATAGESEILASITSMAQAVKDATAKASDLEAKLLLKENELKIFQESQVTSLVESAVAAGKITADSKEAWLTSAKLNFQNTKTILDGMAARTTVASQIQAGAQGDERAKWTYRDWETKDSVGLLKMAKDNEAQFNKLFEAQYGKIS